MSSPTNDVRYAELEHETAHARVQIVLDLDGGTRRDIETGISTLNHLLTQTAFFAGCDLGLSCDADSHRDDHYATAAIGAALGEALCLALTDTGPVERLGSSHGVSEDGLALVALDLVGHGTLEYAVEFEREQIGALSSQSVQQFFRSFAQNAKVSLHVRKLAGTNDHHVAEAIFKALGQAIANATRRNEHHRTPRSQKLRVD